MRALRWLLVFGQAAWDLVNVFGRRRTAAELEAEMRKRIEEEQRKRLEDARRRGEIP